MLQAYFKVRVSQKSLRNDDSIEMLDIIRNSLYYDASRTYGWTEELTKDIHNAVINGDNNVASIIAAKKSAVEENITKTLDSIG